MADEKNLKSGLPASAERMIRKVGTSQERIARGREPRNSVLGSVALLGVVGWSVALPTLVGVAVGIWIDHHWPGRFSWTVMLLIGGLAAGCANAWLHIKGES